MRQRRPRRWCERPSRCGVRASPLFDLRAPEAAGRMIVDDTDRLHPRVDDRRSDELEAATLHLLGDLLGQERRHHSAMTVPFEHLAVGERPAEVAEALALDFHLAE